MGHGFSWMFKDVVCRDCGYEVVVTQGKKKDYRYYCSNPDCSRHEKEDVFDQDDTPKWVCSTGERKEAP